MSVKLGRAGLQVSSIRRSRPSFASSQSHSGVEHYAAVHLSGEADGVDLRAIQFGGSQYARNGQARRAPPVLGLLLRPANLLGVNWRVFTGRRCHHASLAIHQHGPRSSRAYVNSQKHRAHSPSISIASKVYLLGGSKCMRAAS